MGVRCPRCDAELEQDTVDVGVGSVPVGPPYCPECGWSPDDDEEDEEE